MTEKEILDFALSSGIIDISVIQQEYEMKEREKILSNHKSSVYQSCDGYWKTYLPDKSGRKLIKRKTKEELEEAVYCWYKAEIKGKRKKYTLRKLFPEWLDFKCAKSRTTSYPKRITSDWKRFYENDAISDEDITRFDKLSLEVWAHNKIKDNNLTKTAYYNMSIIMRQILDYAKEKGYIKENVFSEAKINTKLFRRQKKKPSDTQVYQHDEVSKLVGYLMDKYNNNHEDVLPIAVLLDFELGLRSGEISAIRFSDVEGDSIWIQRQETGEFSRVDGFTMTFSNYKIEEYTKSDDGYRKVYLTKRAIELLEIARKRNDELNEHKEDYVFLCNGGNINTQQVQYEIRNACKAVGIKVRSMHSIRKTYISELIQSGLSLDEVRRLAGHSDERTTLKNYCFNIETNITTREKLENALNHRVC